MRTDNVDTWYKKDQWTICAYPIMLLDWQAVSRTLSHNKMDLDQLPWILHSNCTGLFHHSNGIWSRSISLPLTRLKKIQCKWVKAGCWSKCIMGHVQKVYSCWKLATDSHARNLQPSRCPFSTRTQCRMLAPPLPPHSTYFVARCLTNCTCFTLDTLPPYGLPYPGRQCLRVLQTGGVCCTG